MELSEEEKKAIEWLEKEEYFSARLYAPIILNLINNYKKEIDREEQYTDVYKDLCNKQQKLINQLLEDMKERANNFSYESEIMWRKIEKAEKELENENKM